MAANAMIQLDEQLSIADLESVKPMAMMIGPVTIGGKNFIIFSAEKTLIKADMTKYNNPAHATPKHAYGIISTLLLPSAKSGAMAAYPPKKAKEDPKNAGTFFFVTKWNNNVPTPANNKVVDTSKPVNSGTNTVAPNIANMCCNPRTSVFPVPSFFTS